MMTDEKKQGIIADYKSGMSIYDISRKRHTHFYAVRDICKDIVCPRPGKGARKKLTPEVIADIQERRKTESVNNIAKSLGISRQRIYFVLKNKP